MNGYHSKHPVRRVSRETTKIQPRKRKEIIMENENTTAVALIDNTPSKVYCSVSESTPAAKAVVYNAINNPTVKISDHIGQDIYIKDIYCEEINSPDIETGEMRTLTKTVLIDPDGNSYFSVAAGVFRAVKNLISIYGYPTYETPVHVKVVSVKLKKGSTYGLQVLPD